ncbi:D-Ala-D-Ala carboxypeptidase family metallohydrolase [Fusobacterium perfoetens]|uniref:D-Ala-D-Ala carboxypeptidase family metallohydrolase n=1 Tax=Fusobacterium perfoetens TaxID=852 RepID=UPI001F262B0B|nr:D-Ala-D-Ala carboxypeptidase family metallohydrolase [Fusobacterium perfoetens]MCF2611653.1 hypothetical protein [Fusobacterium perfoetens]
MKKSYFTVEEISRSEMANKSNIKNIPNRLELHNIETITIPQMNIIREFLGVPIIVNSGYRCKELNRKVGGVYNSKHLEGLAVDGIPKGLNLRECWNKLRDSKYASLLDQCILYEKRGFIHFGFTVGIPRQQFFEK